MPAFTQVSRTASRSSRALTYLRRWAPTKALEFVSEQAHQWRHQCKWSQVIPDQLYPRATSIRVDDRLVGDPPVSPAPPIAGTLIPEGVFVEQLRGRGQSITRPPLPPDPPSVPPGTLPFSLTPGSVITPQMVSTDLEPLVQSATPDLSDKIAVDRLFKHSLEELLERLGFALDWGWPNTIDLERERDKDLKLTYGQAIRKKWCSSKTIAALKKRFARFGYHEKYLTLTSYWRLLEKEAQQRRLDVEHQREQARRRQAKHRKNLPEKVRDQIKRQARERYRKKCLNPERDGKIQQSDTSTPSSVQVLQKK